jgi:hypothetical protein
MGAGDIFSYIPAAYLVIVNFSTVGYGDITAIRVTTRLLTSAILISNITIAS